MRPPKIPDRPLVPIVPKMMGISRVFNESCETLMPLDTEQEGDGLTIHFQGENGTGSSSRNGCTWTTNMAPSVTNDSMQQQQQTKRKRKVPLKHQDYFMLFKAVKVEYTMPDGKSHLDVLTKRMSARAFCDEATDFFAVAEVTGHESGLLGTSSSAAAFLTILSLARGQCLKSDTVVTRVLNVLRMKFSVSDISKSRSVKRLALRG
uniref:Uncharacterized protein n=1 Tax=Globodera rostochiensis TaxID=31243 RepID=A0A914HLV0_GLORO